jgi:hypothetical protein
MWTEERIRGRLLVFKQQTTKEPDNFYHTITLNNRCCPNTKNRHNTGGGHDTTSLQRLLVDVASARNSDNLTISCLTVIAAIASIVSCTIDIRLVRGKIRRTHLFANQG